MDLPPRSAIFGLALQLIGGMLVLVGFLATPGRHTMRRVSGGTCDYIGPDVMATFLHECRPGDNRWLVGGLIIAAVGLASIVIGRRLAKRSGLN